MRTRIHARPFLACLAGGCLVLGCTPPPLAQGTLEAPSAFSLVHPEPLVLGAGDRVRVTVLGHPELSSPGDGQPVDPEGYLHLPLIGPVPVAGASAEDARRQIQESLAVYVRRPNVALSVTAYESRRVYVLGHVDSPGEYIVDRPLTALQTLSLAGAFKEGADRAHVVVLRRVGPEDIAVHVFNGETPGLDGLVLIEPGDLIFVRQSGAGRFDEQLRPILMTYSSVFSSAANVYDTLNRLHGIGG